LNRFIIFIYHSIHCLFKAIWCTIPVCIGSHNPQNIPDALIIVWEQHISATDCKMVWADFASVLYATGCLDKGIL